MTECIQNRFVKVAVRHAKSVANAAAEQAKPGEKRVGGYQPEIPLAPIGIEQARSFGHVAFSQLEAILEQPFRIVHFSSAPAARTMGTAQAIHETMGLDPKILPIIINPSLHEQRKGDRRWGGDEKRLYSKVRTDLLLEEGWDFRWGRRWVNRLGLHALHGAETAREAGSRMVNWYEEIPPVSEEDKASGELLVDMAVVHGLETRYGTAMLLHADSKQPSGVGITLQEADEQYDMSNASAFVLSRDDSGLWVNRGRIIPPAPIEIA